nr:MAG TPA: hypothetical protein [Caudoviricetes sp.]
MVTSDPVLLMCGPHRPGHARRWRPPDTARRRWGCRHYMAISSKNPGETRRIAKS